MNHRSNGTNIEGCDNSVKSRWEDNELCATRNRWLANRCVAARIEECVEVVILTGGTNHQTAGNSPIISDDRNTDSWRIYHTHGEAT